MLLQERDLFKHLKRIMADMFQLASNYAAPLWAYIIFKLSERRIFDLKDFSNIFNELLFQGASSFLGYHGTETG
jgi:hypothetical protein